MLKIFSFLDAFSLLQAAQVNKSWNEVASTDFLWRKLCQKRWFFPDMPRKCWHKQTLKQYFLCQTRQEHSISRVKLEDFIYKEMPRDFGFQGYVSYLSKGGLTMDREGKSVICVVTSMTRLTAWDIGEGFWTSRREDRITLMYQRGAHRTAGFVTFDIELEKTEGKINVEARAAASFKLSPHMQSPEWMGVSDKSVIVCSSGPSLLVYTMTGLQRQRFQHYSEENMQLLVNPIYVIVTFIDDCLEVYKWKERSYYLKKCYRLQNERHLGQQSIVPKTLCDDVSIIQVLTKRAQCCCFLLAYIMKLCS
ncbi:F-box/WD repeat-containing protein 15-like [Cricetulus griseus]|uniref:F-box/WD repeat-containing protein 15-like n=2 Tax=Cricetulus griseus TaxID=10029 RepID=A0A9J7H8D3_CRIGR|nr:F-box/WD repeat-containing protein 15-like [Cricetulus griseus]